jgi:MYXO-CTERM domain-containing protein
MNVRSSRKPWGASPLLLVFAVISSVGCGGQGCSCLAPIPGGFPAEQRTANAGQLRITQSGLAALAADPQALIGAATGGGPLEFDVPSSCGGNPAVCCPGGNPQSPCGPIVIDLMARPGDAPRLELRPVQGASRLDVTVRARVRTAMDIPVQIPLIGNCGVAIDTTRGSQPDLKIDVPLNFRQDATAGTTRIEAGNVAITQLTSDDVRLTGSLGCQAASLGLGFFIGTLTSTFSDAIKDAINGQLCKQCPGGSVDECGTFATACTDSVCQLGNDCMQELGASGRLLGEAVFGGFSPGTTGALDLYEVAGGYATTNNGGIALGLLGGMVPAGAPRDRCGPPATPPAPVTIPQSAFFQGNTRPDTGAAYGLGIGLHEHQLDRFAYAAYDGGVLCLTVGTAMVPLLTSDTFGLFLPSLANLTGGQSAPMAIGIRPQAPPVIVLGKNSFTGDGAGNTVVDQPLLDVTFTGLELDFFAQVEDQYIRLFTLVADLRLPIGLEVDPAGSITPVLGDVDGAFTNLRVKNSDALTESPAELEAIFPMLLDLALPQLAGGLGSFDVPTLGGLQLVIDDITAVDNDTFLAIFGSLRPAMARTTPVDTEAALVGIAAPPTAVFADATRWRRELRPRATLELGGSEGDLEWNLRIDGGLWRGWSRAATRVVSSERFWLQGAHTIEVVARRAGAPSSADPTPVTLPAVFDAVAPEVVIERAGDDVRIGGRDLVSGEALTVRWRWPGEPWQTAPAPVELATGGRALVDLEVEVIDEAGNATPARGSSAVARAGFHGAPGEGGCNCATGGGGGLGAGALALLVGLVVARPRRRRSRRAPRRLAAVAFVVAAGTLPACDCGGTPPCGDQDCLPGSLEHGSIGRWNGAARGDGRMVFTTYDESYGDVVLGELAGPAAAPTFRVIDGVPDETPTYDPSTYRGGVEAPGPDLGAHSTVAIAGGTVIAAYQDRDRHALRFAREVGDRFASHDVDVPTRGERVGAHASITARSDGGAAIAYLAIGVPAADGARATELRLAVAGAEPDGPTAWSRSTVATVVTSCAGLCGTGQQCVAPAADGDPEVCATATSDCTAGCANDEVCVAGACRAEVTAVADTTPGGLGFPTALALSDGRLAVVYYDREATALMASVGAVGTTPAATVLDDAGDRGMWASAVVDGAGTIHVVYQEARGDQVFYTTLAGAPGTPEVVDDGQRTGDRPHNVGAGAAIYLSGGAPHVVYQDGLAHRLVSAVRGGSGWTHADLEAGGLLAGFHVAVPGDGGVIVHDALDKTRSPVTTLAIVAAP